MANALDDAGLKPSDIDGIVCRGPDDSYAHHQRIGERLGINAGFSTSLDNGGASQILSVALAVMAIDAGLAKTVICGYGRDAWSRTHKSEEARVKNQTRPDDQHDQEFGPEYGYFGAVAAHAFGAQRHMHEFGTTREQFAEIAIAFREHASRNPAAQIRKPLTVEEYFKARPDRFALRSLRLFPAQRRRRRGHRHLGGTRARFESAAGDDPRLWQLQQSHRLVRGREHDPYRGQTERRGGLPHGGHRAGRGRHRSAL